MLDKRPTSILIGISVLIGIAFEIC